MIPEIGVVVGLYVLARLTSTARPSIARTFTVLAIVVTALVTTDLVVRGLTSNGLIMMFSSKPTSSGAAVAPSAGPAEAPHTGTVTRADGGSITTVLGYGFAVAKDSSLKREWIAVHDPTVPADLDATPGVTTVYISKQYGSEYRYRAKFRLTTRKALRAVEVRFLIFDVWGQHVRTLSFEEVSDIPSGVTKDLTAEWQLYSENEVEKHYASIGYVARVRLADGRVVEAPTNTVVEEARKFSAKFSAEQLEPKPPTAPPGSRAGGGA